MKDRAGALSGVQSVRKNSDPRACFEKKLCFVSTTRNDQGIGASEQHSTEGARDNSVKGVIHAAPFAQLVDETG